MSIYAGPEITDSGLALCLDAANPVSYAPPVTGSLTFAANSRVRLPTAAALQFGSGDFTVQFWINAGSTQTTFATITDASTNNTAICIGVGTNNGGIAGRLSFFVSGGTGTLNSTTPVLDNTWRHIACVKSGAVGRLFVNGILEASTTNWGAVSAAFLSGGTLGGSAFGGGAVSDNWFAGSIANFAVYNIALYATNFTVPTAPPPVVTGLQLLYNATSAVTYIADSSTNNFTSTVGSGTPAYSSSTPLISTTIWRDVSGQGNNGTLFNSPAFSSTNSGSIVFNGTNQYVAGGIATINSWSMCLWYLSTDITSQAVFYPFSGTTTASGLGFGGTFDASTVNRWYFFDGTNASFSSANTAVTTNVWYNLVVTKSSTTYNLYTNGTLSLTGIGVDLALTQYNLGRRGDAVWYARGNIAQASIYNRALTADEVSQNFQALRGRFGI